MEVRVEKNRKRHLPNIHIDRNQLMKILPVLVVVCLLAGFFVWRFGGKETQAGLDPTKYSPSHPFEVLEIVPYEGQGQWGYMVSGQESVTNDAIRQYYTNETEASNYWNQSFDNEFLFSGLVKDAQNRSYSNKDAFIENILCRSGGNPTDWAGKVRVKAKSACEITAQDVQNADLIVVQSNESAYKYKGGSGKPPLYAYWKYNKPSDLLKTEKNKEVKPLDAEQPVYEGTISKDNGTTWKSMDMSWDAALAVLEHAYTKNKATIVASERENKTAESNIDKLTLLLIHLTRKAYVDDGIGGMITTVNNGDGVPTGSFNGTQTWNADMFYDSMLIEIQGFINSFQKLQNLSNQYAPPDNVKIFLNNFRGMGKMTVEDFYKFMDSDLWNAIIDYAKLLKDIESGNGKITEEEYQYFVNSRIKYEKKQIYKAPNKYEVGYDVMDNKGYKAKTKWDNVIRYWGVQTSYPFAPGSLSNNEEHQSHVEEILLGGTPDGPQEDRKVKVLEIEPSAKFIFEDIAANTPSRKKLAGWLGVTESSLNVTCVTPNELNGMTVDLVAEYDMVYVGVETAVMGASTRYRSPEASSQPYQHIGAYEDSIVTLPLINGLLDKDKTTSAEFAALAKKNLKNPPTIKFLKNTGLSLELGEAIDGLGHSRFSGNDITGYMKKQLKEFISSGQPIVVADLVCERSYQLQEDLKEPPEAQKYFEVDSNLYSVFAETGLSKAEGALYADPSLDHNNVFNEKLLTGANPLKGSLKDQNKPNIVITRGQDADGNSIIVNSEQADSDTADLVTSLKKSNGPAFTYTVDLPRPGSPYKMKVIVDQNGDGIFDEREKPEIVKGINEDAVETIDLTNASSSGEFIWPGKISSGKSVCQFRVIVQEEGGNGLRSVWTGYMRPNLAPRDVKILQIMSAGTDNKLSEHNDFNALLNSLPDTLKDYNITAESFVTVTTTEFSAQYADVESLNVFDLIIVGFDYGTRDADMSVNALKALNDCISVKKKPVIFTKNSISYVNMEYYKTPDEVKYVWKKMTKGDVPPGTVLVEDSTHRRRELTEDEYNQYVTANSEIGEDKNKIHLEDLAETKKEGYEEIFLPVLRTALEDGRDSRTVNLGSSSSKFFHNPWRNFYSSGYPATDKTEYSLTPRQVNDAFVKEGYLTEKDTRQSFLIRFDYFDVSLGWITKDEYKVLHDNTATFSSECWESDDSSWWFKPALNKTFSLKNLILHPSFIKTKTISEADIVKNSKFTGPDGQEYYLHHDNYLARKIDGTVTVNTSAYWEQLVEIIGNGAADEKEYQIVEVGGTHTALYPDKPNWGYRMSQSLRYPLGMDRFSITEAAKTDKENKRKDSGTTRELSKEWLDLLTETQGFTNGALLEFACTKNESGVPVIQHEPYGETLAALGITPGTDTIEALNKGAIGHYPFRIGAVDAEEVKIFGSQYAPFYQLDLERSLNKGKTDDITVWYTFGGSDTPTVKDASKYFDLTRRDAGNNYYLYSKENVFYTGYNLPAKGEDSLTGEQQAAQEMEMKLFINTIYAALSSSIGAQAENTLAAVVKAVGTVSCIERAEAAGNRNRYVCYYEEGDGPLIFDFRVQAKIAEDPVKVSFGIKKGTDTDGSLVMVPLVDTPAVSLPVEAAPEEVPGSDGGLSNDTGTWYQLEANPGGLDGQTLIIGVGDTGSGGTSLTDVKLGKDAIHAEIQFVMRNLFDLD